MMPMRGSYGRWKREPDPPLTEKTATSERWGWASRLTRSFLVVLDRRIAELSQWTGFSAPGVPA